MVVLLQVLNQRIRENHLPAQHDCEAAVVGDGEGTFQARGIGRGTHLLDEKDLKAQGHRVEVLRPRAFIFNG